MFPSKTEFISQFEKGHSQLVWMKLPCDTETPVSMMLKLMPTDRSPCFLLESVHGGEIRGRYSIVALDPDLIWRCKGNRAEVNRKGSHLVQDFVPCEGDSLDSLRRLIDDSSMLIPDGLPPMAAGLIGYMGYDMVRLMERLPDRNPDPINIPDACFMRPRLMVILDAVMGDIYIISPVWYSVESEATQMFEAASQRILHVRQRLHQFAAPQKNNSSQTPRPILDFRSNFTQAQYYAAVERAKEYIRAGDIFQVVPSQRFQAPFDLSAFSLYRALRHLNPSPFLFYLQLGDYSLVGSSPEILVRLRGKKATIRPIAGTRRRGGNPAEDTALAVELLADAKERAEHLMLLDLGRNDMGRVAKPGSVRVTEQMIVEYYSHVMHIVSNVEGEIREDCDAVDALIAGFPAGTVSGAPKIRAMEIIDELEPEKRSFYAGCVGYFSANGDMDTCISLRTALVKDGMLYIQAGGGVVADSDPKAEYMETVNKAKALMRAAQEAWEFI